MSERWENPFHAGHMSAVEDMLFWHSAEDVVRAIIQIVEETSKKPQEQPYLKEWQNILSHLEIAVGGLADVEAAMKAKYEAIKVTPPDFPKED